MNRELTTSAYVPCYNAEPTLEQVLAGIADQSHPPDEIFIIDDGSTDATAEIARQVAPRGVEVVAQPHNLGLAAARNRALHHARGDVLVSFDADVLPDKDFIANGLRCLRERPELGALCGRLREQHAQRVADRWRATHMSFDFGPEYFENPRVLFCGVTCIRRTVVERVGGWDERFRSSYEDVDFTQRLRAARVPFAYEPACRARHLKRDTPQSVLAGFWNWFKPAGVLGGHFDSYENWIRLRLDPVQWGIFRYRFAHDLAQGRDELLPLTLLLPWVMTAHDLCELQQRFPSGDAGRQIGAALPDQARQTFSAKGVSPDVREWVAAETARPLRRIPEGRGRGDSAVVAGALQQARRSAARSLPSNSRIWSRVEAGLRALQNDQSHAALV